MTPKDTVDEIFAQYRASGERSGRLAQSRHGLQCATLARFNGEQERIVAACLLHDYGQVLRDLNGDSGESIQARYDELSAGRLARYFKPEVVEPIRLHLAAQRYLCWKDRPYYEGLDPVARQSLDALGGPMNEAEARAFKAHPHFDAAVRLLRYDEMGRVVGMWTPDYEEFRPVLEAFVDCR